MTSTSQSQVHLPRVEIKFCVKCKWNLRAAYYAQELLQTFCSPPSEITLGEIALVPVEGGIFTVTLYHAISASTSSDIASNSEPNSSSTKEDVTVTQVWDRKADGGFPETKELKNRIRNLVDPSRRMGHIDRSLEKGKTGEKGTAAEVPAGSDAKKAEVEQMQKLPHRHGDAESGDKSGNKAGVDDCEECRLASVERVEGEVGDVPKE